jgi:hypothetical protein
MAGTVIADRLEAQSTSQLVIENGVALTPPTIVDVNNVQIGTFCRAWVNFNGTGTVAIRASFNVSSITDNGTGDYTVNFTNALPDANYSFSGAGQRDNAGTANNDIVIGQFRSDTARTTSSCRVVSIASPSTPFDAPSVMVSFFR